MGRVVSVMLWFLDLTGFCNDMPRFWGLNCSNVALQILDRLCNVQQQKDKHMMKLVTVLQNDVYYYL